MSANTGFKLGDHGYNLVPRNLSEDEKKMLSSVFYRVDAGNKGYLDSEDIKVAIAEVMGYKPSKFRGIIIIYRFFHFTYFISGIGLDMYLRAMTEKVSKLDLDEQIRHTFMAMDFQCHGFLTVEDLRRAFSEVAPHIPAHSIDTAFRELDRDGDGRISYKDFDFMMKYDVQSHI
ncbi:hypothetical protein FSP39_019473 [Pinctada imbricata]|uniref:EF-hand domain-containing protein n=1 Tax=Pinctada imbricata TaxID=66713 RepID=A0AA88YCD1_PINIB|nr:hypothetical protein FSP39_019473 [Pinctada imbricata]